MATQRRINFTGAMHELRAQRARSVHQFRNADGSFNKSAIMKRAIQLAKQMGSALRFSWSRKLAVSLRTAWQQARMSGVPVAAR